MARRKLTDDDLKRMLELRRQGMSIEDLADRFSCSRGTVSKYLKVAIEAESPPSASSAPAAVVPAPIGDDRPLEERIDALAERSVTACESLLTQAENTGDLKMKQDSLRLLQASLQQVAKLKPRNPVDPNDAPDMVAAAKRVRRKLHDLLERLIEERAARASA